MYEMVQRSEGLALKCKKPRNDHIAVALSSAALSTSLEKALASLQLPNSMNPSCLCPTGHPESQALLSMLVDKLRANPNLPMLTPREWFINMGKLAFDLLKEMVGISDSAMLKVVLPPGFEDIVSRWMKRTVNDAVGSLAEDENDMNLTDAISKLEKTKIDPRDAKTEKDLDDILATFEGTKLDAGEDAHQTVNDGEEL